MNTKGKTTFEFTRPLIAKWLWSTAFVWVLLSLGGCASSKDARSLDSILINGDRGARRDPTKEVPSELVPLFERLQMLVREREDQAARNVLARIYAHRPSGRTLELADGFDRVLKGRALVSAVRIELVTQAHAEDRSRYRVALFLLNESTSECTLRPGPATLTLEQTLVDGNGHERRNETSSTTDALPAFTLVPGEPLELSLQEFTAPVGLAAQPRSAGVNDGLQTVLAARYSWHISLLSSVFVVEDAEYPAMHFEIAPADRSWVSAELPKTRVSPAEFVERVGAGELSRVDLMSLAVRIPSEESQETLRLLMPAIDQMGQDRLRDLTPALRWISGDSRLGDDPAAWRAWIADREQREARGGGGLDLPSPDSAPFDN